MMNQVFHSWDEVSGEIRDFTLPAPEQAMLDKLWEKLGNSAATGIMVLDLADLWDACENHSDGQEVGTDRKHAVTSNGTHLVSARFGRDKQYVVAWHPEDQDISRDTITAVMTVIQGEDDGDDEEFTKLLAEVNEKLSG